MAVWCSRAPGDEAVGTVWGWLSAATFQRGRPRVRQGHSRDCRCSAVTGIFMLADQCLEDVGQVLHPLFEAASGPVRRIEDVR